MDNRFNLIDDEWIGLDGAEYLTAIEDSQSPKKTVYFAYNENAKGICDLLNELNNENQEINDLNIHLQNRIHELTKEIAELKKEKEIRNSNDCTALHEYRTMVHTILQNTYEECNDITWRMNNLGFIKFAKKLGYDIKVGK